MQGSNEKPVNQIIIKADGEKAVLIVTNESLDKTAETTLTMFEFHKIVDFIEYTILKN